MVNNNVMLTWKVEELQFYKKCGGNHKANIFKCNVAINKHKEKSHPSRMRGRGAESVRMRNLFL